MTYEKEKSASLDLIAIANNKLTTDELIAYNKRINTGVAPSPMWHLTSKQRKGILNSIKRASTRTFTEHGWPLDAEFYQ